MAKISLILPIRNISTTSLCRFLFKIFLFIDALVIDEQIFEDSVLGDDTGNQISRCIGPTIWKVFAYFSSRIPNGPLFAYWNERLLVVVMKRFLQSSAVDGKGTNNLLKVEITKINK